MVNFCADEPKFSVDFSITELSFNRRVSATQTNARNWEEKKNLQNEPTFATT